MTESRANLARIFPLSLYSAGGLGWGFLRRATIHARANFAFTLIELLMVLAIVAIMVALIAPSLRGFTAGRGANDAARVIVSEARFARTQSISEGRTYRLNFDPNARLVWLTVESGGQYQKLPTDRGENVNLPDGELLPEGVTMQTDVAQQQDGQYLSFTPSGRSQAGKVTLTDKLGRTVVAACASATELFRVVPPGEATP